MSDIQKYGLNWCFYTYAWTYGLFTDVDWSLELLNDKLDPMWEEAFVAEFGILSLHFPGGIKENSRKTWYNSKI
jgi:hypothetical protein